MSIQPDSTQYTSNAMPCIINEWVRRQTDKEDTEDYASQYILQCFIMFTKELQKSASGHTSCCGTFHGTLCDRDRVCHLCTNCKDKYLLCLAKAL